MSDEPVWGKSPLEPLLELQHEIARLRGAIIKHRDERGDDRCWMDDHDLYAVLGDGVEPDNHVGDKHMMVANCYRFIENRCAGGKWTSYIDLEKELNEAHYLLDEQGVAPRNYTAQWPRGGILVPATRSLTERIKRLIEQILRAQETL